MKVAFDVDGVLTTFPDQMRRLIQQFNPSEVIIVTGRPESAREFTLGQLAEKGVSGFGNAYFYPEEWTWHTTKGGVGQDMIRKLIEFKRQVCKDEGVDILIEDDPRFVDAMDEIGVLTLLTGPSMKMDNFSK